MSTAVFADWSFTGTWHRYQQLALDAFERDRANGGRQTLIVAPPGAGKTLIGLEVIRRLNAPALVLCPTQTIQRQWQERQDLFGGARATVRVLTYQGCARPTTPGTCCTASPSAGGHRNELRRRATSPQMF